MATDGFLSFNGTELCNIARSVQLAETLGIDTLWITPDQTQWLEDTLDSSHYADITYAPWYDAGYPPSMQFAGVIPLSMQGLDDSSLTSVVTEYITDGGHSGKSRNATQAIVASVAIVASSEAGAEFGLRWMNRQLKGSGASLSCSGGVLHYYRYAEVGSPLIHRRDVRITRGTSVTRKRINDCSSTWFATFTLTAADPYEYGEAADQIVGLGCDGSDCVVTGPTLVSSGLLTITETGCPEYDYTPVYDPLYPALVTPPTAPDILPAGWAIADGDVFTRYWARLMPDEPTAMNVVPIFTLDAWEDARTVRVSIWPWASASDDQCDPLFSAVIEYIPAGQQFVIDSEQKVAYIWDGISPVVRRADSLVYSPDGGPVEWTAFNDPDGLLVTLDAFSGAMAGGSSVVETSLSLVPKSD
jgi:hypothetical protein